MSTIKDVARAAGVSIATVSRVLNHRDRVDDETRKHVFRVVEEMQYTPNNIAVSMVRKRSKILAAIIPDLINPFYSSVIHGVETAAKENGYYTFIFSTDENPKAEHESITRDIKAMVDGVILISSNTSKNIYRQFDKPLILLDRYIDGSGLDGVVVDNFAGARTATEYLLENNHRRIAIINGSLDMNVGVERLRGFERALADGGLPLPPEYRLCGGWYEEDGRRLTLELMALPEPPTAIFAANNLLCIGVIAALQELGLKIGRDISLVAFDDNPLARFHEPRVSVVERPTEEMGRVAVRMLLEKIRRGTGDRGQPAQIMTMGTTLIRTASVRHL
jgi:LacI family transcriptional regulator